MRGYRPAPTVRPLVRRSAARSPPYRESGTGRRHLPAGAGLWRLPRCPGGYRPTAQGRRAYQLPSRPQARVVVVPAPVPPGALGGGYAAATEDVRARLGAPAPSAHKGHSGATPSRTFWRLRPPKYLRYARLVGGPLVPRCRFAAPPALFAHSASCRPGACAPGLVRFGAARPPPCAPSGPGPPLPRSALCAASRLLRHSLAPSGSRLALRSAAGSPFRGRPCSLRALRAPARGPAGPPGALRPSGFGGSPPRFARRRGGSCPGGLRGPSGRLSGPPAPGALAARPRLRGLASSLQKEACVGIQRRITKATQAASHPLATNQYRIQLPEIQAPPLARRVTPRSHFRHHPTFYRWLQLRS